MVGASARNLRCSSCNAAFAVERISATVHCPYCGHGQTFADYGELLAYEQAVQRRADKASEQAMIAASLEAWTSSSRSDPKRRLAVAYGFMIGLPILLALVLVAVDKIGLLPKTSGPGPALAIGAVSYLGLAGFLVWSFTGRIRSQKRQSGLRDIHVACPTCGAPGALTPGEAADNCAFCGAALIPSRAAMNQGVDAARLAAQQASLNRRRASREASAKAQNMGAFAYIMPILIVGSMLLMIGGSAVGFSVQMLTGSEPYHPAIFLLWALTLAILGGSAVYCLRYRLRRDALRNGLEDIAKQLSGKVLFDADARLEWLNRYWIGEYERTGLGQSYVAAGAAISIADYNALIDIDLRTGQPAPRVELLLAAWVPRVSDGQEPSGRARDETLKHMGFHVRRTAGGLHAVASKEFIDACRARPESVHVLVPALSTLVALAKKHDCQPTGPIP
jgi:hypothetical protein